MNHIHNTAFLAHPMERHVFSGDGNAFLCDICERPRALHQFDGFIPNMDKPRICMRRNVRFNRHRHFHKPGSLMEKFSTEESAKIQAARFRYALNNPS